MLKVYQALSFQGILKGNKTSPWLALVNVNGEVKTYILKLFDREKHYEGDAFSREIIGNVLAEQFGFNVQKCALIDISSAAFELSILNKKAIDRFKNLKIKIAFGTEYLYPNLCFFNKLLQSGPIMQNIRIDSVFAFDMMIRNTDRNFARPNLLVNNCLIYLIDFESSFQLRKDPLGDVLLRTRTHTYHYMHVFHALLCNWEATQKSQAFEDFFARLESAEFSVLDVYVNQLVELGFILQEYQQLTAYLEAIKQNRLQFHTALKSLLYE